MTDIERNVTDTEPKGRLRSTAETLGGFIRRIPFSIALAVVLIATAAVTGTMFGSASEATTRVWGRPLAADARSARAGASRSGWATLPGRGCSRREG